MRIENNEVKKELKVELGDILVTNNSTYLLIAENLVRIDDFVRREGFRMVNLNTNCIATYKANTIEDLLIQATEDKRNTYEIIKSENFVLVIDKYNK